MLKINMNNKQIKRKEYSVLIGEKLKECLDRQKESIKEATYEIIDVSYYNAGEVLAAKINKAGLV